MLHKEAVKRETFELLTTLMRDEELQFFNLAGGTALALYMGHRLSLDLDFFTPDSFDARKLENYLIKKYRFRGDFLEKNTLKGSIDGVKIDYITHDYPFVEMPETTREGVRLYGIRDIAAMKLSVIADNGTRLKDFIDIACLSTRIPLSAMLQAYQSKYPMSNLIRPVKGLAFYNDINFKEPVQMIGGSYKWDKIEKRLNHMIKCDTRVFAYLPIEFKAD